MEFDVEYEIELLPTEPLVSKSARYDRQEHVFFISYQQRQYQLVLTESMSADLHKRHGDVYERFKGTTVYIKRTKIGRNHFYDIRGDVDNQAAGLPAQSVEALKQMRALNAHVVDTQVQGSREQATLDEAALDRLMEATVKPPGQQPI